jgi:5-methyltetrahydrofolate--homocysteine methyltransferase
MSDLFEPIFACILEGDNKGIKAAVQKALDSGLEPGTILNQGMINAMSEVGKRFEEGEYYVPEMLISARAMKEGLELLRPLLIQQKVQSAGVVILGTVKGDLHDIGKNLVGMMLEGSAFEIVDLGTDVSPENFVQAVQEHHPNVIALSALLTTTMPNMEATIKALKAAGLRDQVKVIIGGAPVTEQYAREIGADGYAADASRAVSLTRSLVI